MCHLPLFYSLSPLVALFRGPPGAISHSCVLGNRRCRSGRTPRVSLAALFLQVFLPLSLVLSSHRLPRLEYPYQQRAPYVTANGRYGYLSYQHVAFAVDELDHLTNTVSEVLGTRSLITCFLFPSLILDHNSSGRSSPLVKAFLRTCVSSPRPDIERPWHEVARFGSRTELDVRVLAHILCISGCRSRPHNTRAFLILIFLSPEYFRAINELWHDLPSLFTNESESLCPFSSGHGSAPPLGVSAPSTDQIRSFPAICFRTSHRLRNHMLSCH